MSTRELVQAYYESLNRKDDKWQELYTEGAVFSDASGTLNAQGKGAVIQSFVPFLQGVEKVEVTQLIVEGEAACAVARYSFVNPKGQRTAQDVAELWRAVDDKLDRLTIYFDLTAYRSFMRPG